MSVPVNLMVVRVNLMPVRVILIRKQEKQMTLAL